MLPPFGNVLVMKTQRTIWTVWIIMEVGYRNDGKIQSAVQRNDNLN